MTGSPYVRVPASTPGRLVVRTYPAGQMIVNAVRYLLPAVLALAFALGMARAGGVSAVTGWAGFGLIVVLDVYAVMRFFYYMVVLEGTMLMERALLGSRGCDLSFSSIILRAGGHVVRPPVPPMQAGRHGPMLTARDGRAELNLNLRPSPGPEKLLALADAIMASRPRQDPGAELAAAALRQWAAEPVPGAAGHAGPPAAGQA